MQACVLLKQAYGVGAEHRNRSDCIPPAKCFVVSPHLRFHAVLRKTREREGETARRSTVTLSAVDSVYVPLFFFYFVVVLFSLMICLTVS